MRICCGLVLMAAAVFARNPRPDAHEKEAALGAEMAAEVRRNTHPLDDTVAEAEAFRKTLTKADASILEVYCET